MEISRERKSQAITTNAALRGKPYAGNPYVRFEEGEVASACTAEALLRRGPSPVGRTPKWRASGCAKPRRGSLLYKTETTSMLAVACMAVSAFAGTELAPIDASAERNPSPLRVDMKRIGTLRPRGTDEIKGSPCLVTERAALDMMN